MAEADGVTAEALAEVFARYRGEMTGKARKLLQDAGVPPSVADADDIVSSAFATALRDPGAVRQPRAYLYKLIRTEVVHLATRCAEHRRLDEKRAADPLCCPLPDTADFSTLVDNRDAVHRAIHGLSVPQRTAVWAVHALDYTRGETAVLMGRHPGTVARHTTRALLILRAGIAATVVCVLTALLLTAGGRLQRTTPANGPRPNPVLPGDEWWSRDWVVVMVTALIVIGACAMSVLSRREHGLARRLVDALSALARPGGRLGRERRISTSGLQSRSARSSMTAALCANCHRLMDSGRMTQEQRNALWRRVETESRNPRAEGSSCQFCGHRGSSAAPLESAYLLRVADEPLKGVRPPVGSMLIDEDDF